MGAENATLVFMVGGCDTVPKNVESILLKMGARVVHCGASGMGQVAKLCNNMLLGATMVAVAETFNAALKLVFCNPFREDAVSSSIIYHFLYYRCGINAQILSSIINSSSGRCWSSDVNNPIPGILKDAPSTRNYQVIQYNTLIAHRTESFLQRTF